MSNDIVLRGGTIYDGSGDEPFQADVTIQGDTIAEIAEAGSLSGKIVLDVAGLAVAPGFIFLRAIGAIIVYIITGRPGISSRLKQYASMRVWRRWVSMR